MPAERPYRPAGLIDYDMTDSERDPGPLDLLADGFYEVDREGRFTRVNEALCRLLRHREADILGHSYTHFTRNGDMDVFRNVVEGDRFEWELDNGNGQRVFLEGSVSPIRDGAGRMVGYRGIIRDVSGHRRTEHDLATRAEELERRRTEAVAAARHKADFVAAISHELRSPMAGIIGMTDLALETDLDREQRDYLGIVRTSANSLLTLINDILDFSKIEAGRLNLESIPFNLRDCIADLLKPLSAQAQRKGLDLLYEIDPSVPDDVNGDPTRLRQIVINLVDNAIKFTRAGHVLLRVTRGGERPGGAEYRFEVADTGVGVPAERQASIFDSFIQAETSTSGEPGGTGLGLAISRQLVELMGGKMWLRSEPGEGSVFYFTARLTESTQRSRHPLARHDDMRGVRVLVADGHQASCEILVDGLKYFGLRAHACGSAVAAREALERAVERDAPYRVAVIDSQLPDGNGFRLAAKIRDSGALGDVQVILLTRSGQRGDAARCRKIGVMGYLSKPIGPLDLLDGIRAVVATIDSGQTGLITRHSLRSSRPRLDVLVAEDDSVNQLVIRTLLEKAGHRVTVVAQGREALQLMECQQFDVVLMDVEMPEMNGVEATSLIREREVEGRRHTPVVALTAHPLPGDRDRFVEAGMDDFLPKPFEPGSLFAMLERLVPVDGFVPGRTAVDAAAASQAEPIVDRERLLEQTGGDPELLRQVVEVFLEERATMLDGIRLAVERMDAPGIERAAHRLKSTFATLAARVAAEAAAQLERMGRAGELSQVQQLYKLLEEQMRQMEFELVSATRPWPGRRQAST